MKERKRLDKSNRRGVENSGNLGGRKNTRRRWSVGLVDADRAYLKNSKKAKREAQGAHGLNTNCRESISPSSRPIRGLRNKYH